MDDSWSNFFQTINFKHGNLYFLDLYSNFEGFFFIDGITKNLKHVESVLFVHCWSFEYRLIIVENFYGTQSGHGVFGVVTYT